MRFVVLDLWWMAMAVLIGTLLRDLLLTLWRRSFGALSIRERADRLVKELWPQIEESVRSMTNDAERSIRGANEPLFSYSGRPSDPEMAMAMAYSAHLRGELTQALKDEAIAAFVLGYDWPGLNDPQWLVDGAAKCEFAKSDKTDGRKNEEGGVR